MSFLEPLSKRRFFSVQLPAMLAAAFVGAAPLWAAPDLDIQKPERSFGDVDNVKQVRERFTLKNTGDQPLVITQVTTSCGCTSTFVESRTIKPGESTLIEMVLDLRGLSGPQVATTTLYTNIPGAPPVTLRMTGNAVSHAQITPSQVFFPQSTSDAPLTATAELIAAEPTKFKITQVRSTETWLSVETEQVDEARGHYRLKYVVRPGLAQGMHSAKVFIKTDAEKFPELSTSVAVPVVGRYTCAPAELELVAGADPVTRHLILTLKDPAPDAQFKVRAARVEGSGAKVDVTMINPRTARLRVSGLSGSAGSQVGPLVVELDDKSTPRVVVPVKVRPAQ